jgi:Tol biopolymer transport system component
VAAATNAAATNAGEALLTLMRPRYRRADAHEHSFLTPCHRLWDDRDTMLSRSRSSIVRCCVAAASALLVSAADGSAATPTTTRVSISSTGAESSYPNASNGASISANGRFVVFRASADFDAADTNDQWDIYLRDRKVGQTTRISVSDAGVQNNSDLIDNPLISADGRYIVFRSAATTLDAGATNGAYRLYRYDRVTDDLQLIPLPAAATGVNSSSAERAHAISADGSRIAFRATLSPFSQIFLWEAATGQITRVSQTAAGVASDNVNFDPSISGDGRFVAFTSQAANLVTPDITPGLRDIFVKNLSTGAVERISDVNGGGAANSHASTPALNHDGCIAAFFSSATNLVLNDTSAPQPKVFAKDRCGSGNTEIISVTGANSEIKLQSSVPITISDDGCRVSFLQTTSPSGGVNMRDRCTGLTQRIDSSSAGTPANGGAIDAFISGGSGRFVTLSTTSDELAPGDTNGAYDVFVRDLGTNVAPVAALSTTIAGNRVTADASASDDPDGYQLTGTVNWGDGTPPQPGLTSVHDYAQSGTYGVTVTVTDADGTSTQVFKAVTVGAAPAGPADQPPGGGGGGGGGDTPGQLILDRVSLGKTRFVAGKRVSSKVGTALTLRLNAAATVTLRFERSSAGRRVKGACRVGAKKGKRCTRYTRVGTITRSFAPGTSSVAISGTLGKKKLAVGAYRLSVTARGGDGKSTAAKVLSFSVTAPKKRS